MTAVAITCPACRGAGRVIEELRALGWRARRTLPCSAPGCVGGVVPAAALGVRVGFAWNGMVAVYRVAETGLA
ncbi:hypothetical protein [Sorangium sp. So ce233]|uniref:hypothetical protein n=1 Tax=Sorangium sp. So ce233 TaxID=3133290 RepID=UPI003F63CF41